METPVLINVQDVHVSVCVCSMSVCSSIYHDV